MSSLQHVYRRGHVFWWRRVHRLFDKSTVDVRVSLRTTNRSDARNMGAALTAALPRVVEMLDRRAEARTDMTERELQVIARAMYEARLTEVCTEQRSTPYNAELHSAVNHALVDYFERLRALGGHMSFLPAEHRKLQKEGWSAQRIADLQAIIALREDKGVSPIRKDDIDRHLADGGFAIDDRLRWMVELALYPTYRDVYSVAEQQLRSHVGPFEVASEAPPSPGENSTPTLAPAPVPSIASDSSRIPEDWLRYTPTEAAERMIAAAPRLLEHRQRGKRAKDNVGVLISTES